MHRTKATPICPKSTSPRAVRLPLGHAKIEGAGRYVCFSWTTLWR
jgi:hypothetical protein